LCEPSLRSAEDTGNHLRRHSEFLRYFPSRMGLTAQPEKQTNDLLLLRAELPQPSGDALEIHAVGLVWHPDWQFTAAWVPAPRNLLHVSENTRNKLPHQGQIGLAFPLLLIHEWS